MKKQSKKVTKILRLLRRIGAPRWLHRFGPKKYQLWQHTLALLVRQECQLSYRRTVQHLSELGFAVPSYSALIKMTQRLPARFWQALLAATCKQKINVLAIDSSSFSRSNPSYHYLRRIVRPGPVGRPVKTSFAVDTATKKIVGVQIRVLPAHDVCDVPALLKQCKPRTIVADKGYDSEAVHEHCFERGITSMIPARNNVRRGFYRRKQLKCFRLKTYHRRELAEALISKLKRCFGSVVRCKRARTIRAELMARAIACNIMLWLWRLFHQSRLITILFA